LKDEEGRMTSVTALGYIGCSITDAEQWDRLLATIYGMERRNDSPEGAHQYRLDEYHHRLTLYEAEKNKLDYIGWEVETQQDLQLIAERLEANSVKVTTGNAKLRDERAVLDVIVCTGPDKIRTEIYFGPKLDFQPFAPKRGIDGFNTGKCGLGHVVLASKDRAATAKWYQEILGFKLSDYIYWDDFEATFLHCNPRHHSLAFVNEVAGMKAGDLAHFMFEAKSLDDVGRAYDIVHAEGFPIAMTLGRHTNDNTTSFYLYSPSGWWVEYGYGGRLIDDNDWEPKFYNSPKIWGHDFLPPPDNLESNAT